MEEYEFIPSEDACPACQAMQGTYGDKPMRPHENCRCEITQAGWHCRSSELEIHNYDDYAEVTATLTVDCCCAGEETYTESITKEVPYVRTPDGFYKPDLPDDLDEDIESAFDGLEAQCTGCRVV